MSDTSFYTYTELTVKKHNRTKILNVAKRFLEPRDVPVGLNYLNSIPEGTLYTTVEMNKHMEKIISESYSNRRANRYEN